MENKNIIVHTQSISLSKEVDTEGFDLQAGETWIYPTNYPPREYQYNIIETALLKNTLVSLPTGLGKTFIAAVVMYNFYRWYPHGKIIFMAPTKPLVKQQVDACYNIMAIPPEVTAELTGAKVSSSRTNVWVEKRVFFVTPQVLQNDLNKIQELGSKIKCLVFDEAHKAKGNHAYCEVIRRLLAQNNKYFRVLALSATPGSNVNDVLEVIQNLLISHLEFRTEESLDVHPYVFQRSLETVVVPLGKKLEEVKDDYLQILEQYVKTLIKFNVVQGNCCSLTKGKIFMLMKDFQNKNRGTSSSNYSEIMRCLNICVTLYHAFELLIRHGLRNFLSFYDEHIEKPLLRGNYQLRSILNNVREYLGPIPNIEILPDGTYPEIPKDIIFGHPKYYKLRDVLVSHFSQGEKNTRVIVFFEYRESVMEAHTLLLQSRPLIQPKIFVGQGSGITQKVQIGVVKAFREGRCNTLLSTCIGEEGLDVGEVDLIICFDISNKSPIRMVQRMGRTGRKREGRILVLVTEGKEQQTLKDCLIHKNNISTYVLGSKQLKTGMYPDSPRLVPINLIPRCEKMFITVRKVPKNKTVKDLLNALSSNSSGPEFSQEIDILDARERMPKTTMLFNKGHPMQKYVEDNILFSKYIEKQRIAQKTHKVKHSKYTRILTDLLSSADSKRFNIPTQVQSLTQGNSGKNLKQRDIRNMFFKRNSQQEFQSSIEVLEDIPTQVIVKEVGDHVDLPEISNIPKEIFTLVSNFLFTQMANPLTECKHCPLGFRCEDFAISSAPCLLTNNNWVPSDDILDTISLADLENFSKTIDPTYQSAEGAMELEQNEFSQILENMDCQIFNNVNFTQLEKEAGINRNIEINREKSFSFDAPKSYSNLLSKFGGSIFISQEPTQTKLQFDSSEEQITFETTEKALLDFFMWESLGYISSSSSHNSSQDTVIYSPTLSDLDTNDNNNLDNSVKSPSPILSLGERKRNSIRTRIAQRTQRSYLVQSQICRESDEAEGIDSSTIEMASKGECNYLKQVSNVDLNDVCDLSYFGISNEKIVLDENKVADIDEICDLSSESEVVKDDESLSEKRLNDNKEKSDGQANSFDDFCLQTASFQVTETEEQPPNNETNLNDLSKDPSGNLDKETSNFPTSPKYQKTRQNKEVWSDINQTFLKMDFDLPTQHTNLTNKYDIKHSKLNSMGNSTQTNSHIDNKEDDDVFAKATGPTNSKKNNILKPINNVCGNEKEKTDPPAEKDIEYIDLTIISPTRPNEKCILSCESQMPITQMISFLNKTSQKENLKDNAKVANINSIEKTKRLKLSIKKNTDKQETGIEIQARGTPKNEVDPYLFSTGFQRDKKKLLEKGSTSSDEFEDSVFLKTKVASMKSRKKIRERNKKAKNKPCKEKHNEFLDVEAQISEDENLSISEDEDDEGNDYYEKSFVNDETQNYDTQMHAKYLQSTRSPVNPRRFKIPLRPAVNICNVYSQPPSSEMDTYLEDSFCVDTDDVELTQENELSQLEILEKELKRKKKRGISKEKDSFKPKRRRVICYPSDDSD